MQNEALDTANKTLDIVMFELRELMTEMQKAHHTLSVRTLDMQRQLLMLLHDLQELEKGK